MPEHAPVVVTPALLRDWRLPDPTGSKDTKGRLVVVGGCAGNPGAVLLAAEAALRSGAGKVQVATVGTTATQVAVSLPEAFVTGLPATGDEISAAAAGRVAEQASGADAVLVGPGIGDPDAALALLEALVPLLEVPLVVDALATAFLTQHPDGLGALAAGSVVTPNIGELSLVIGADEDEVAADVPAAASRMARATGATVLAGSDVSHVVAPDGRTWTLGSGAPGSASAGSGDVKAGVVAGLLARGAEPTQAAVWGAYLHDGAGERLTSEVGRVGFLARDLVSRLPRILDEVET
ncbi:NAD(P)H-hydrate dehydratase [Phycicoccus jejuensis]|uniref:NAD(P)H-hydrate dehydratase n=1 Tax=Phycicoccus jejuensis TaxID=367299 RepID=UPI0004C2B3E2|nr:NAD(P)H-hydrate dehydratase [Phycicoccus jejuensis]